MPTSNYPNGFANGVTIRGVPVTVTNPGNVFWVDSGAGSNGNKGTFDRPFATIDYAIGRCTASNGDIIFVRPGHTETVSAAGGIAADVAGVAIIGLGKGSLRPTITLDTATAATVTISAANVTMHNLKFVAGFADIVAMITVTATDAHIDMCEFVESGANLNWVDVIDCSGADNTADGLTVTNCRVMGVDAGCDSLIEITGDIDRLTVEGNFVNIDTATATAMIECATGKDVTNGIIRGNVYQTLKTAGDLLIDNDTDANSGIIAHNLVAHADTAGEVVLDAGGMYPFENYASGVTTASGYLLPAVDS